MVALVASNQAQQVGSGHACARDHALRLHGLWLYWLWCTQVPEQARLQLAKYAERQQARQRHAEGPAARCEEGESTDEELEDVTRVELEGNRRDIRLEVCAPLQTESRPAAAYRVPGVAGQGAGLLADVVEEFSEIKRIAGQFETWKRRYRQSYMEAFVSDSVKKIFKPLVTLQLLAWNPLRKECAALDSMAWFNDLAYYGVDDSEGAVPEENDPDARMVPNLVELAVVPKLAGFIEFVYDPRSSRQVGVGVCVAWLRGLAA
jgi:hypothetical protein